MTIVVTVKINDGIVLASDSATTFSDPSTGNVLKIYNNANKLFNLVKGKPIGALTFGAGGIGSASIATISKDLRRRFSGDDPLHPDWALPSDYSMEWVARKVREFFFDELYKTAYQDPPKNFFLGYKICGYGADQPLPELWNIAIEGDNSPPPTCLRDQTSFGPNWDGEYEAMDRLILGVGSNIRQLLHANGVPPEKIEDLYLDMVGALSVPVVMAAMPIQDAIELATFMVETTIRYVRFNLRSETVGGPVEVATITKHEGFRWVRRKHFFPLELNS